MFATIILAILFPVGQHLKPFLPILLAVLLFFNFYSINFERKHFFQREILIYFLVVLVIFPGLVFIATKHISPHFRIGIFLTTITPAAISGSIVVRLLEGNMGISVANILLYNLLSPLSYSILTKLYFNKSELTIPAEQIIVKLLLLLFIPFLLAAFVKKIPQLTHPLRTISAYINFLFLLILFTAISSSSAQLRIIPGTELMLLIAYVFVIAVMLYASGFVFGKDAASKSALAVNMGQKNISLCIWLALANFGPLTTIPPTLYIIIHHLLNSLLILLSSRNKK